MARIAFCWEMGLGLGHIVPHLDLIRHLVTRGDEVVFLAQDPARVQSVFKHENFSVLPLAPGHTPVTLRMRNADSFPQVLFNSGYHNVDALHQRLVDTMAMLDTIDPDLIVCDYAPTVMLANHTARRPLVVAGHGFWIPPRSVPMPRFRYWLGTAPPEFLEREATVLAVINRAISRFGTSAFENFADFLAADCYWLCMFEELDFYAQRAGARYLGIFPDGDFGVPPQWPNEDGAKVFAYLNPGPTVGATLAALTDERTSVCLYAPDLAAFDQFDLPADIYHCSAEPVSLPMVAAACRAFVNNGNLSTAAVALLAGKPQLCLPGTAEQYMNARRIEQLGAGLAVPQQRRGSIAPKLHALLKQPDYTRAARRFARKYADTQLTDRTERMLLDVDELLGRPGA